MHSDCGNHVHVGQANATESDEAGDNIRWTALCTFSGIFRYHAGHHVPWRWGVTVEDSIRRYLQMRAKLLPSLVAGGHATTLSGWPLAARCDLHAPQCGMQARKAPNQFVFLNDTLVAPIDDQLQGTKLADNVTTRSVWLPPGTWTDAWTGQQTTVHSCGTSLNVTVPYERIPLWHRAGGLIVTAGSEPGLRAAEQDWRTLTLEVFPHAANGDRTTAVRSSTSTQESVVTRRAVVERGVDGARTELEMRTFDDRVQLKIGATADGGPAERGWIVRLHLRPSQCVIGTRLVRLQHETSENNTAAASATLEVVHLAPLAADHPAVETFMPFGGAGSRPSPDAGHVAELRLAPAAHARSLDMSVSTCVYVP